MRYVPSNCLRPGQKLATDVKFNDNRIFLKSQVILTERLIARIKNIGFQGLYIDDDISKDLTVANIVSDELMYKAKTEIKSLFLVAETPWKNQKVIMHLRTIRSVINEMVDEILRNRKTMINVVDLRTFDDYTFSHSLNVAVLSVVVGTVMKMERHLLQELAMGSLIHDIGKIFIDKNIINKNGKLTPEEYEQVKQHSQKGYDYLLKTYNGLSDNSLMAVLEHHEQYNGEGYPNGLVGDNIHLFGRIICVADVYDALTSDRPYRRAMLPSDGIEYIMGGFGRMFDPQIVDAFIRKVAPYPVGTIVKLSNGVTGIVVENFENAGMRPRIQILEDGKTTKDYIDLKNDRNTFNLTVQDVVKL